MVQQEFIHQEGLDQFQVVMATLDGAGAWLATVEERKQETAEAELNLKLWAFDEPSQRYLGLPRRGGPEPPEPLTFLSLFAPASF